LTSLEKNTSKEARWWIALGILMTRAYYHKHPRRGYRVDVYHENQEILGLLTEAFGGTVSRGKSGKAVWYISGEDRVRPFVAYMEPFMTKSQWSRWLVTTGKIVKGVCSACGAQDSDKHEGDCYLAP
jgi:hypothetical protein